jgi:uncharacterized protein YjeT (DUF2065 family)
LSNSLVDFWEYLLLPVYAGIVIGLGYFLAPKDNKRLFTSALSLRVAGAVFFAGIYLFYYGGGDTLAYYHTAVPFVNMFLNDFQTGLRLYLDSYSIENYTSFNNITGYPLGYIYSDSQTFTVSKILVPLLFLSFKSYLLCSVLLSGITFIGSWKLFLLFKEILSDQRIASIAALFIPSVLFWGSGISKDTITYTSAAYFVYSFYFIIIKRKFQLRKIFFSVLALYIIISIKPYIFLVLLPGILLWLLSAPVSRLKNTFLRRITLPLVGILSGGAFFFLFNQFSDFFGSYAADQILEKALVTQEDLKRDYYGGNSFDIGTVSPTFLGVLSKVPIATFYGLFGPTIFQVRNILMLFSAAENTVLAFLTLRLLVKISFRKIIKQIADHPIFLFCIIFSLAFAFSIGFTTPNFGALVRFKIPLMPFFTFFLLGMYKAKNAEKGLGT